jgi:hypothetical protein
VAELARDDAIAEIAFRERDWLGRCIDMFISSRPPAMAVPTGQASVVEPRLQKRRRDDTPRAHAVLACAR